MPQHASRGAVPAHVPAELVFEYDYIADPLFAHDPHAGLAKLFENAPPIFFTPCNGGHWVVTAHDAMDEICRDDETFSNARTDIPNSVGKPQRLIPTNLDRPHNTPFRMLLMRRLGPKAVKALEARVRLEAQERIAAVRPKGHCEFVAAVAAPLPARVFMEQAGMPVERAAEFQALARSILEETDRAARDVITAKVIGILTELIEARMARPTGDIISDVVHAEIEGRRLTLGEMQSMCYLLFLAGLDTVVSGIAFAARHLAEDPQMQARLTAQPDDIPAFVEEALRRYGIAPNYRQVQKDVSYRGVSFCKGEMLMCLLPVSGIDPTVSPDPLKFDIDREDPRHLAFSTGPHSCIGQHLARMEMRVALEEWLKVIPRFHLAHPSDPVRGHGSAVIGFNRLELAWNA